MVLQGAGLQAELIAPLKEAINELRWLRETFDDPEAVVGQSEVKSS